MLIAIDGSEGWLKAVDYVGGQFAGVSDFVFPITFAIPLWRWG